MRGSSASSTSTPAIQHQHRKRDSESILSGSGGLTQSEGARLDKATFIKDSDALEAFGFVDPADIIRAAHLVPAFSEGRSSDLLGASFSQDQAGDWARYYAARYVFIRI
jgi:hypothetical protein